MFCYHHLGEQALPHRADSGVDYRVTADSRRARTDHATRSACHCHCHRHRHRHCHSSVTATALLVTPDQPTPPAASVDSAASANFEGSNTPCHTAEASNADHDGKPCLHCVLCDLAGASVPPTVPTVPRDTLHELPESIDSVAFTSFIAELPQRPPSLSRA